MKTFRKVLAAALSAVMLVSTMAIPSFAANSPAEKDLSKATVTVSNLEYTGQDLTSAVKVTVTLDGVTVPADGYTVSYTPSPVRDPGSYTATVMGKAPQYKGTATGKFEVVKPAENVAAASNTSKVTASATKAVTTTVKLNTTKAVKKKTVSVKKVKVSKGGDQKTAKKIKVKVTGKGTNQKLKIKIPKGAKKGTYKIKVKYKVKGSSKFKTKTVTVKVKKAKKK